MKILRIIARLNVGGPARHVIWLTSKLQDAEFQSELIAGTVPAAEEDMGYFARDNGVEPIYVPELSRELSPNDIVSFWKIYRQISRYKPDIVHTHTAKAGTVGRAAVFAYRWFTWRTIMGRPRRLKVVHTFHGHVFHSYYGRLKTRIFITIEKVLARIATDRIIAISEQQFREIHEEFSVGSKKQFRVVPLGIDITSYVDSESKRHVLRDEIDCGDGEIVVGFVGRLTRIKNLQLLLRSASLIKENEPKLPIRFVVIGDGELRESLEQEAATLDLAETVRFLGNRDNINELLPGLDIAVLTSANEGTPLSLIEAMMSGVPFVSTSVGGVVDLAGEQCEGHEGFQVCERGILALPDSPDSVARGLIYLAKNEKLRESLSERGRAFVTENYSLERLEADIKKLYRDLTGG